MQPKVLPDHDRALLFLYILDDRTHLDSKAKQLSALANIAGWTVERAEQAITDCVCRGHAMKLSTGEKN